MLNKILLISMWCCLFAVLVGAALYFFGPATRMRQLCPTCGKEKVTAVFLGMTWFDEEVETNLSEWYDRKVSRPHDHQWVHLCSFHQQWGGGGECWDSFGFELEPLRLLKDVSEKADPSTFDDLVNDYNAMRQDETKISDFVTKCRTIVSEAEE